MSVWKEYISSDNRKYYYNHLTKVSTWKKPDDFQSNDTFDTSYSEVCREEGCPWKEYVTSDGTNRKYYYNHITKVSSWNIPDPYKKWFQSTQDKESKKILDKHTHTHENKTIPQKFSSETSKTDKEKVFITMLESSYIESNSTWEEALRKIVNHPDYGILKTVAERKQCFMSYMKNRAKEDRENSDRKEEEDRERFSTMLRKCKSIHRFSTWNHVNSVLKKNKEYHLISDERTKKMLFEDYINGLKKIEEEKSKKHALQFLSIIQSIKEINFTTRWKDALILIEKHKDYNGNPMFREMERIDMLHIYEDFIKEREKEVQHIIRKEREISEIKDAISRDNFRNLLKQLIEEGEFHSKTTWKNIFKLIRDKEEFLALVFTDSGSNPLEIFFDFLDEIQYFYYDKSERSIMKRFFKDNRLFDKIENISYPQFANFVDEQAAIIDKGANTCYWTEIMREVHSFSKFSFFWDIHEKEVKERKTDERRHKRHENFLRLLKEVDKEEMLSIEWDDLKERFKGMDEFMKVDPATSHKIYLKYLLKLRKSQGFYGEEGEIPPTDDNE